VNDRAHGPINQNAFIVSSIDAGISYWTRTMQVGPFFKFPKIVFEAADYRGRAHVPEFDAAIAYSGDLMIELIRPRGPSIFQEFLDSGRTGVHHLAAFADDAEAAAAAIEGRGGRRVQGGRFADGSSVAYFDMGGPEPSVLEIACLRPAVLGLFSAIKAAGAAWDGASPTVSF
jgi:Glyoxalase/Bleomycin resistance protein/Dioxygenase superfamily